MSLRSTVFAVSVWTFFLITLCAAGATILSRGSLNDEAMVAESHESISTTETVLQELLIYRDRMSAALRNRPQRYDAEELQAHAKKIKGLLPTLYRFADNDGERDLIARVTELITVYFRSAQGYLAGREAFQHVVPVLASQYHAAETAARELTELNIQQADEKVGEINRHQTQILWFVWMTVVLALVSCTFLWMFVHRRVYQPLYSLMKALRKFSRGESVRVELRGSSDMQEASQAFNRMAEALEVVRERQLQFLASVVHDIKNPLSAIRMSAECLAENKDEFTDDSRSVLEVLERQSLYLEQLVNDLFEAAKANVEAAPLERETTDMNSMARDAFNLFRSTSNRHQFIFSPSRAPIMCDVDPSRMSQVLNNLLSNAIKYSPSGGEIRMTVRPAGDEVAISVSDQGIGVSADEQKEIFSPFFRSARARHEKIPGTGLGLASAQKILRAHGGRLEVTSVEGGGAEFTLYLKCRDPFVSASSASTRAAFEPRQFQ